MDTPRPVLKKRITISRWGPALNSAEKGENIEATHQSLPNGTGSGSKEEDGKIVCRIMKVNKGSNFGEKTPVISKSSPKTFDEEQNSSETGDFLGFVGCEPEIQNSFLKALGKISRKEQTKEVTEESEITIESGFTKDKELDTVQVKTEKMTVDTRPDDEAEEEESDNSSDKSNSDDMEIDENKDNETVENDNSSMNVVENVQDKSVHEMPEPLQEEDIQESDKILDESDFTIKEEVLSINDYGGKESSPTFGEKLNETLSGSELDVSISDNQNDNEQTGDGSTNTPGSETDMGPVEPVGDNYNKEKKESPILNGTPGQTPKKKSRTRESSYKSKKAAIDISDPAFLKPFDFGWKRELVYRSTNDTQNRRQSDVYYYTPKGKKVRSFREVLEHLVGQDLTIDNFTFFKEALGVEDTEKEIIRDAKLKLKDTSFGSPSPILKKTLMPKTPKTPKTTPISSQETVVVTPSSTSTSGTPSIPKSLTPRVVFRGGKSKLGNYSSTPKFTATQSKNSIPGLAQKIIISKVGKRSRKKSEEELEMGMLPPMWQPVEKVSKARDKESSVAKKSAPAPPRGGKPMEVCNIRCPLAMGLIPTLQCHICLCLYHPECVGLEEAINRTIHSYKCKNCQLAPPKPAPVPKTPVTMNSVGGILTPPPLTPISTLNSINSSHSQFGHLSLNNPPPKLTRLTDGKIVSVPRTISKPPVTKAQSIVGGVTTWLPPSSTIQLSPSTPKLSPSFKNSSPAPTSTVDSSTNLPAQTLITMNGKRFVVVPKHNVLSVSPAVTAPSVSIADPSCPQITPSEISPSLTALATQAYGPGGPILPKPTPTSGATFLVSSPATPTTTFQNPPGVLLVPYLAPQSSQHQVKDGVQQSPQPQYVIVNGPSGLQAGNFIFGNLPQQQLKLPAIPTSQAAEPPAESAGIKRLAENLDRLPPTKKMKFDDEYRSNCMQNFVQNMGIGYKALLQAFQYLTVQELLRAGRVCHMWRDIAMHKSLWETVRMKNSRVRDWEGVSQTLRRVGTRHLDLRKIIIPDKSDSLRSMWSDFIKSIAKVNTLVKLDLCRCSSQLIEQVATACPQLENLNALSIRSNELNLTAVGGCKNMTELRLKSVAGISVSNIIALKALTKLKHLSLTSIKNVTSDFVEILNKMVVLETLELGECTMLPEKLITESLPGLTRLRRLRLEKGQGTDCPTILLLETISRCPSLTQLELINFDVKPGFDNALALCSNIKSLLIIPTYVTQSATTNHVVMEGVSKLSKTLTYFVWGLTLELLRVTDLFIDQWEGQKNANKQGTTPHKKSTNDCIPILKPEKDSSLKSKGGSAPLQVDVLQLAKLHKVLMTLLPTTQIKILKVPFSATWRQTIPGSSQ